MNPAARGHLEKMLVRQRDIENQLAQPDVIADQGRYRNLNVEYSKLQPLVSLYLDYKEYRAGIRSVREMLADPDPNIRLAAQEELEQLNEQAAHCMAELETALIHEGEDDTRSVFLEIRAGTGGIEAALFAGDLYRMYTRYAEMKDWAVELINVHESEQGGFKEMVLRLSGGDVYARLKFESGVHRVQRVPVTESQGRVHTSAATVAVLPEAGETGEVDVSPDDLRIDTFRASGAGGQHVNKTDSAIRIMHLPSGLAVECQDERSQHRNRLRAMNLLRAKLLDLERSKQARERAEARRNMVGSGDRSERIRTYNFPQGRVTDHRINLTLYQLPKVMEGGLDTVIDKLISEDQARRLANKE